MSESKPLATGPWWTPEPGAFSAPLPAKLGALNQKLQSKLLFTLSFCS